MIPIVLHGITNQTDALAAARLGVTGLGFHLHTEDPRYIEFTLAKTIIEQIPNTVHTFLESDEYELSYLQEITRKLYLSSLLVPIHRYSRELESLGCSITLTGTTSEFLAGEGKYGGATIVPEDLPLSRFLQAEKDMQQQMKALNQQHFLLLACDVHPDALPDIFAKIQPAGIILEGQTESRTGLQEYSLIHQYVASLGRIVTRV
ncbi:MAG TPA: hypothetical protein VKA68_12970 [bacterium]|nr:hypothetical protein [bacterium]